MRYIFPHYYNNFTCISGDCENTCCAGWQITIDEISLKRYQKDTSPLRGRLHNSIDWTKGVFRQYQGHCELLNENGLCDLCAAQGEAALCKTCHRYPRHVEAYENVREYSLALSCPEVARIILGVQKKVRFITKERNSRQDVVEASLTRLGKDFPESFDAELFEVLTSARTFLITLLQIRDLDIRTRASMSLSFSHDLQRRLQIYKRKKNLTSSSDASRELANAVSSLIQRYSAKGAAARFTAQMKYGLPHDNNKKAATTYDSYDVWIVKALPVIFDFAPVQTGNLRYFRQLHKKITALSSEERISLRADFRANKDWSICMEQLLVYFVSIYFCGAVYDADALSKMKFAIISTLFIEELCIAELSLNQTLKPDWINCAHRFARELEHSDHNIAILESAMATKPVFTSRQILTVLHL